MAGDRARVSFALYAVASVASLARSFLLSSRRFPPIWWFMAASGQAGMTAQLLEKFCRGGAVPLCEFGRDSGGNEGRQSGRGVEWNSEIRRHSTARITADASVSDFSVQCQRGKSIGPGGRSCGHPRKLYTNPVSVGYTLELAASMGVTQSYRSLAGRH